MDRFDTVVPAPPAATDERSFVSDKTIVANVGAANRARIARGAATTLSWTMALASACRRDRTTFAQTAHSAMSGAMTRRRWYSPELAAVTTPGELDASSTARRAFQAQPVAADTQLASVEKKTSNEALAALCVAQLTG